MLIYSTSHFTFFLHEREKWSGEKMKTAPDLSFSLEEVFSSFFFPVIVFPWKCLVILLRA